MGTKKQAKDKELDVSYGYDYKKQIAKEVLKLYIHTISLMGIILIIIGLEIFRPVPEVDGLIAVIIGVIVVLSGYYYTSRLDRVE